MKYTYKPQGVCSKEFIIDVENNIINNIQIIGGCAGNTLGISNLLKGMNVNEAIKRLKGIPCGYKGTSCPDQIAIALEKINNYPSA